MGFPEARRPSRPSPRSPRTRTRPGTSRRPRLRRLRLRRLRLRRLRLRRLLLLPLTARARRVFVPSARRRLGSVRGRARRGRRGSPRVVRPGRRAKRGLHARAVRVARRWAESAPARVFGRDQPEDAPEILRRARPRPPPFALYHGETLPLRLTDAFLDRAVLGARASLEDLKSVDPTLYANKVRYLMDLHGSA